jgi:general secretion pathway protein C
MSTSLRHRLSARVPALAALLAAAASALLAGGWLWSWLAPPQSVAALVPPAAPDRLASQLQTRHLFGAAGPVGAGAAAVGQLRLVGAVAGAGIALIAVDGRPAQAFRVGGEIAPGIRLTSVAARGIAIERAGVREFLPLPVGHVPTPTR